MLFSFYFFSLTFLQSGMYLVVDYKMGIILFQMNLHSFFLKSLHYLVGSLLCHRTFLKQISIPHHTWVQIFTEMTELPNITNISCSLAQHILSPGFSLTFTPDFRLNFSFKNSYILLCPRCYPQIKSISLVFFINPPIKKETLISINVKMKYT